MSEAGQHGSTVQGEGELGWLGLWSQWGYAPGAFSRARVGVARAGEVVMGAAGRLRSLPGGEALVERLCALRVAQGLDDEASAQAWLVARGRREVEGVERLGGWIMVAGEVEALAELRPRPPFLYGRGERGVLARCPGAAVSIVGTRQPDVAGARQAEAIARSCARQGVVVVSGGALGIDACAHRGACEEGGASVVVLAVGLDRPYPRSHGPLFEAVVGAGGVLLSPFPLATPPRRHHFPRRNGLIAALGGATVVVRAGARSGALHTAREAVRLGRALWAVPGDIGREVCVGSNRLLGQGARPLLEAGSAGRVLCASPAPAPLQLAMPGLERASEGRGAPEPPSLGFGAFSGAARRVVEALGDQPEHPSSVVQRTGLSAAEVAAALLTLELGGAVLRVSGGRYVRPVAGASWRAEREGP